MLPAFAQMRRSRSIAPLPECSHKPHLATADKHQALMRAARKALKCEHMSCRTPPIPKIRPTSDASTLHEPVTHHAQRRVARADGLAGMGRALRPRAETTSVLAPSGATRVSNKGLGLKQASPRACEAMQRLHHATPTLSGAATISQICTLG
jgi:hypothetical protein